jgi:hypothetical protein
MRLGFRLMRSGSSFITVSRLFILCALLLCFCLASSLFTRASCRHRLSLITTTTLACCCFGTICDLLIFRVVGFAILAFCVLIALSVVMPVVIDFGCAAEFIIAGLLAV